MAVTGAAGFIGSTLCEALLAGGWQVRGIDAFTTNYDPDQKRANLEPLLDQAGFSFVEADLCDAQLGELLDSVDAVAHLAGEPGVSTSWGPGFAGYVARNVHATQRLLDAVTALDLSRFVYASSSSVYGNGVNGPVLETTLPRPASPYGVTKLAAEHLVSVYASLGVPTVSLRYFSVYGPRQRPDMALHRFIERALDGRPLTVYGDGGQVRDFTYVDDIVAATVAALTAPVAPGTVLNLAAGNPVPVATLVDVVGRLLELGVMAIEHEPERPGDVAHTNGSVTAARKQLGWRPQTDLETGVADQIEWHRGRRHRNGGQARTARRNSVGGSASSDRASRLLIYTQDGLGLGHLRRAGCVAGEFLRRNAGGSVLTVSDSPMGTLLRDLANHDYLKLPSIVKAGPGDWRSLSLPLAFPEVLQLRSRVIHEAALAFEPDVMLVDHMPHGAMGELTPTLEALRGQSTRVVLGLRDIIDAPEVVQQRWDAEGAYRALERYYDDVLVYGSQEVFDLPAEYRWPTSLAERTRFCGYVCTPQAPDHPRRLRARRLADVPDGRLIVVMAGGGADGYELMSTLLDALPAVVAEELCAVVMVTGPFMPQAERRDLKRRAAHLPVRIRTTVRDPVTYVAAADLVVAMGGYNTTMEILRVGTPAVLVPRRGPSSEQRMRVQRFADRGWVSQVDTDELTPTSLALAMLSALTCDLSVRPRSNPDLGGLARAVDHLSIQVVDLREQPRPNPAPRLVRSRR